MKREEKKRVYIFDGISGKIDRSSEVLAFLRGKEKGRDVYLAEWLNVGKSQIFRWRRGGVPHDVCKLKEIDRLSFLKDEIDELKKNMDQMKENFDKRINRMEAKMKDKIKDR